MLPSCAYADDCLMRRCRGFKEASESDHQVESLLSASIDDCNLMTCRVHDTEFVDHCSHNRCKRARTCGQDESNGSDYSDGVDIELSGGILSSRKNRYNVPRNRLRNMQIMLFEEGTERRAPEEFDGCLEWAKIILNHYYLVCLPGFFFL